jgi:hypothetical protein
MELHKLWIVFGIHMLDQGIELEMVTWKKEISLSGSEGAPVKAIAGESARDQATRARRAIATTTRLAFD